MKQKFVDSLRHLARTIPIPLSVKMRLQFTAFRYLPSLFRHMPAYQWWSLQHPELAAEELKKQDMNEKRAIALESGIYQSDRPGILMISHSLGGGTEYHVKQLADKLKSEGVRVWVLRCLAREWVQLQDYHAPDIAGLIYHPAEEFRLLVDQLKILHIRHLHVHHLVDFNAEFREMILQLCKELAIEFDFTSHDYLPICPRFTLYDEGVRGYCGEPDVRRCQGCVSRFNSSFGKEVDVAQWRDDYAAFLQNARKVMTPDADVQQRLQRYLPDANIVNRPHWDEKPITPLPVPVQKAGEARRIMTLGGIAPHKGSHILLHCAQDVKARHLPLDFTLIGYSDIDSVLDRYMKVTGRYRQEDLPEMLREGAYHMVFLPAVWPETFNYTLSEILHYGLYPVCFDIGAIARRIREIGYGTILPYRDYRDAKAINEALLKIEIPQQVPVEKLQAAQIRYGSFIDEYYALKDKFSA
jgi:glycosyltransferase involved in cell wall biosynthesis